VVKTVQRLKSVLFDIDSFKKGDLNCVSVKLSEVLEQSKRLDASHFDIEGKKARQKILDCPYPKLALFSKNENTFVSNAFYPGRFKRVYVPHISGVPFLSSSAILDFMPMQNCKFISPHKHQDYNNLMVKNGWVLVSRSGTVGNVAFAGNQFKNCCLSEHVIRLIPTNMNDGGYVYAFLKTRFGQALLNSNSFGSVVTEIEPKDFSNIPVPNPPTEIRTTISEQIKSAFSLRDEARSLMTQSQELLFNMLCLPSLDSISPEYIKTGEPARIFSEQISNWKHRLDSSFHLPIVNKIIDQLKKTTAELTTVGDTRVSEKIILPGRFKRIYVGKDYGTPFLSGGDILQYYPVNPKYLSVKHHGKRIEEQLILHENMILITCSGTIGNVVIAPKYLENWSASQHVMRIVPSKETNAGYTYTFLTSSYGKELIKRFTHGSVVNEIDNKQLASVEFPLPAKEAQDKIGNLVLVANKKITEAYLLEKQAIESVESIIEEKKA
jgi:type I restriction enzyme, S subunit